MYIPRHFELHDEEAVRQILEDYGFALLITSEDGVAEATHLPLIHDPEPAPQGRLLGHVARANGQRQQLEAAAEDNREVLAVFLGPHSYVSPNDYGPGAPTVPTWNHMAVHVYGVPRPMTKAEEVGGLLERLTDRFESGRARPWSPAELDPEFLNRMLRGVFAFEIAITRIQAKAKLSQNRTPTQAAHAAASLQSMEEPMTRETGRRMRAVLEASS
jgi:transcriptional regulator